MNPIAAILFIGCAVALLVVQRRWAPVPLLVGCCYMTLGQGIELGSISLPIFRMLLFVGLLRVVLRGEHIPGFGNAVDKLMLALIGWLLLASFFHDKNIGTGQIYAFGFIFNFAAVYFLIRSWCRNFQDAAGIIVIVAFLLAPIAIEMIMERVVKFNQFSVFGGTPPQVMFREGSYRAQGPFRHPILAGTVGAVCIPLFVGIWARNRLAGIVGTASGLSMIITSGSSGPIMSVAFGVLALIMWRFKDYTRHAQIAMILAYFAAQLKMGRPGYWVMGRVRLVGGSTGYHRALLIDSAFRHLDEWWLFGTDMTRHWMPTGVSFSPYHTDITNYYIAFGVQGGLVPMIVLIMILMVCFRMVGMVCRDDVNVQQSNSFMAWCMGAGLFSHAFTGVSVAYFDQSLLFFWMNVAIVSAMYSAMTQRHDPYSDEDTGTEFEDRQGSFNSNADRLSCSRPNRELYQY